LGGRGFAAIRVRDRPRSTHLDNDLAHSRQASMGEISVEPGSPIGVTVT
jgi:hypothetical protein